MKETVISKMPEGMSYQVIKDILLKAHQENYGKGIVMRTTLLSPDQLRNKVGEQGTTFLAFHENTPVGTASCITDEKKLWYCHGKIMNLMLVGVIPAYQGNHIFTQLLEAVEAEALGQECIAVLLDTAEDNTHMQDACWKHGYQHADFRAFRLASHYSVIMVKWLVRCPYPPVLATIYFHAKRIYTRMRFKPSRVKRFGI